MYRNTSVSPAPQSIYRWLDGRSLPSIDNLYALQGAVSHAHGPAALRLLFRLSRKAEEPGNHKTQLQLYSRLSAYASYTNASAGLL